MKTSSLSALVAAIAAAAPLAGTRPAAAQAEMSKDIIAVQIRKQGFECKNPQSATHDTDASKPDAEVWVLACDGVSYRVQLIPKQAAKVEQIADAPAETSKPDPAAGQSP
jgi:hypothetical protein